MAKLNGKKIPTLYDLFHKDPLAGKGVSKKDELPRNFKNFFKLSWWHMGKITSVNLIFLVANFPMWFILLAFSGLLNDSISAPASSMYSVLFGTIQNGVDPVNAALYGVHGVQGVMSITTTATLVMYALGGLMIFTFGFANIGTTYILRNLIKGDPVFIRHDFFYAIKRNLRQGFIMGIIDLVIIILLAYDMAFFFFNMGGYTASLMFYASVLLAIIYSIMRFYIYNLIITFDLSLFKVIKNSFIFSALGLKRNLLAFLGIALLLLLDYYLIILITPLGVMLPLIVLYGYCAYIGSYASWPKIKQIMVDPYASKDDEQEEEPVFTDDVQ